MHVEYCLSIILMYLNITEIIYHAKEIEETIKKYPTIGPVYNIQLTDDIFGLNKKWRREFLALYRERIKIPFICLC